MLCCRWVLDLFHSRPGRVLPFCEILFGLVLADLLCFVPACCVPFRFAACVEWMPGRIAYSR